MINFQYKLEQKLKEVYTVPPNDLGFSLLTSLYHRLTKFLKTLPFLFIIPVSFIGVIILYILFGSLIVKLVTLLQYGF